MIEMVGRGTMLLTCMLILATVFCGNDSVSSSSEALPSKTSSPQSLTTDRYDDIPNYYSYRVVNIYPHDRRAFTQGLVYHNGVLYEGIGGYGQSALRKVEIETGRVLEEHNLLPEFFGEGITIFGQHIFQLTWKSHLGFIYDQGSMRILRQFRYATEGWGITNNDNALIMSDGTSTLYYMDPTTFELTHELQVTERGRPVENLNELEYIGDEIYSNIWMKDVIVRISPDSGKVTSWINMDGLLTHEDRAIPVDVLNGIAYDDSNNRLFVTGKLWPKLFEIELIPSDGPQ